MNIYVIVESPQVINEAIQVMEGTDQCEVTLILTNLTNGPIFWKGKEILEKNKRNNFGITFNNITRDDSGTYIVESPVFCYDKSKNVTGSVKLDVICKCLGCTN